jgi:hypothetical protein
MKTKRGKVMNPFGEEQPPPLEDWYRHQHKMNGDSIARWSQSCISANAIRRPAGPNGGTESDNLGARIANEHLKESYIAFCKQQGVRPENSDTFGKACTRMFGPKQRLPLKGSNGRRPPAYDVPTAEAWQARLDARIGIKPPECQKFLK